MRTLRRYQSRFGNIFIGRREEVYRRNGDSEILNLDIENEDGGGKFRESDIGR